MHAFMHWCQYEVRNFSEIEEEASLFAQENCIVADMYIGNRGYLGQVTSDEEQKQKDILQYAVTLELLCKELGEKSNYLF